MNILVVDDLKTSSKLPRAMLEAAGCAALLNGPCSKPSTSMPAAAPSP